MTKKTSIDDYLAEVPEDARAVLEKLRATIKAVASDATETISYQVPTFKYHGSLVGFAEFKEHLSFFLMSTSAMGAHVEELEAYDTSKVKTFCLD